MLMISSQGQANQYLRAPENIDASHHTLSVHQVNAIKV
jgi:hypothetical protein